MKTILKSAMLWRFLGGFALGAVGVLTLHPADRADRAARIRGDRARYALICNFGAARSVPISTGTRSYRP